MGQGRTNAEVAAQPYMSLPTVKARVSSILTKLEVSNRVQIALIVHDAGPRDRRTAGPPDEG